MRKITLEVPVELLERAQRASGTGVTETVRAGLRKLVAAEAFEQLRKLRGSLGPGLTWQELKDKKPPVRMRARAAARNKGGLWRQPERGK